MQNTQVQVQDNVMTITIDLTHEGQPSQSGKSIVVAKTEGFQPVDGAPEFAFNLNVIRKKDGRAWRRVEGIR